VGRLKYGTVYAWHPGAEEGIDTRIECITKRENSTLDDQEAIAYMLPIKLAGESIDKNKPPWRDVAACWAAPVWCHASEANSKLGCNGIIQHQLLNCSLKLVSYCHHCPLVDS
jgi:hypothetical protein